MAIGYIAISSNLIIMKCKFRYRVSSNPESATLELRIKMAFPARTDLPEQQGRI